jgi:hypothetical protein
MKNVNMYYVNFVAAIIRKMEYCEYVNKAQGVR